MNKRNLLVVPLMFLGHYMTSYAVPDFFSDFPIENYERKSLVPGDNDDDSVLDGDDDDDDNDGILDVEEIAACNNNLSFEFYDSVPTGNTVNNIPTTGAFAVGLVNSFDVDALVASLGQTNDTYSIRYRGTINITTPGNYTFYTNSDDGSSLTIDGTLVVDNDGNHAPRERSGMINLTAGIHTIVVLFYENFGGEVLDVEYQGPGIARQDVPFSILACDPDIDNDGLPNVFDTDSDGDGCPDALEGDGSFNQLDLDVDGSFGDNVDASGVPIVSGMTTEQLNVSSYRSNVLSVKCGSDNDLDGLADGIDLDDDNDGILDFDEAVSCINTLNYEYYDLVPSGNTVNNIPTSGADATGTFTSFDVDALIASLGVSNETFSIRYTGLLNINTAGTYTFYISSDDGSSFTLDGNLVVINDGLHGVTTRSGTIDLNEGAHFFTTLFFENFGGEFLRIEYQGPGIPRQDIPFSSIACNLDTDGDGDSNFFDTDSDNDTCLDAIEADGTFTLSDIDIATGMLTGNIDANGIPLLASPGGQANNSSVITAGSVSENTFDAISRQVFVGSSTFFNISVNEVNGSSNFQWQIRNSPSDPFTNLSNGGATPSYSGVNTETLTISGIPLSLNSAEFRVVFSNENTDCIQINSTIGNLSVRSRTVITNRRVTFRVQGN
ncbi:PA14 domain-containing protein [uncultured Aquimarina sp.]|uniref:PA14 domain-containing protein n=1 Tax=uncultured Aquimarina sp. TaxID=575652 RepID=UPI00262BEE38|nr:PA14 domain-containing protein [uncultured Aquimarina sp.]